MKKNRLILIVTAFILMSSFSLFSQNTSNSLDQKYSVYKKRFQKHFIVSDRTDKGCVNDGIGLVVSLDSTNVFFEKEGFGLPATRLYLSPNGAGVVGRRLNARIDHDCNNFGISWTAPDENYQNNPKHKFNWMHFSSETLTQMGWWLITMSTEYELMGRKGDKIGQQKALEEIFLGLQAIRRLDMQTQYLLDKMYEDRKGGDLVCSRKSVGATKVGWWNNCHRGWNASVKEDAAFYPDYSGYNGFFIRCDAGQKLENYLNDPTDESWNVDAIGGAFAGLNSVPESKCPAVDSFCYLVDYQHFMSHDQLINLFYGFLFVKKFIPRSAKVTTCDGKDYFPLRIMQKISEAILLGVASNHLVLPGSKENCSRTIKMTECEGGNLGPTIFGMIKVNEILQDKTYKTSWYQRVLFRNMGRFSASYNGEFFIKETCGFLELSGLKRRKQKKILKLIKRYRHEILILGNDLLFPEGELVTEKVGGQSFFKELLESAPLDGPCHAPGNYREWAGGEKYWPRGFECNNVPGWEGDRWQTYWDKNGQVEGWIPPRRGNGLDYMALFNMYELLYSYPE